jgi:hypothetical protein
MSEDSRRAEVNLTLDKAECNLSFDVSCDNLMADIMPRFIDNLNYNESSSLKVIEGLTVIETAYGKSKKNKNSNNAQNRSAINSNNNESKTFGGYILPKITCIRISNF